MENGMNYIPDNFSENLRKALADKNIPQADLAQKIRQSTSSVSHIVTGQRLPTLVTACDIAEAVGVSLEELLK